MLALNRLDGLTFIDLCHSLLVYQLYASAFPGVTTGGISSVVTHIVQRFLFWCILSNDSKPIKCSLIACTVLFIISLDVYRYHTALSLGFVLHQSRSLGVCLVLKMWRSSLAQLSFTTELRFHDVLELAGIWACHLELRLNRCHHHVILLKLQFDLF